jgi:uncharacterized membrane protein YeaQ/YmgE (transglycosylase-associated protein family)
MGPYNGSMGLIVFILFGFVVGLIARALHPGRDAMGWMATTVLGVAGSLVGWLVGRALGFYHSAERVHPAGLIFSIIGAVILLVVYNAFTGRRRRVI